MASGQLYNLQITGYDSLQPPLCSANTCYSGNPTIHNAFISFDTNGALAIPASITSSNYTPAILTVGQTPHPLISQSSPQSLYTLQGPAGKGIYQLQSSISTEVHDLGSSILYDNWDIVSEGEYSFLRYKSLNSGFWVAVPEKREGEKAWEVWWLQPSGATVEDFGEYVMVDIEVTKMEKAEERLGREREL